MKHNKYKNVGVIYEALCTAVLREVSENNNSKAKKFMSIINKYFLSEGAIQKSWSTYHQLLYNETVTHFYADRFINLLVNENRAVDKEELDGEINNLFKEISSFSNKKDFMKVKTPNYKLFASFNILSEKASVKPIHEIACRQTLSEHLMDNKEAKRLRDNFAIQNIDDNNGDNEEVDQTTKRLSEVIAINTFKERYNNYLNEEQKDLLIKYITKNGNNFNKVVHRKAKEVIKEVQTVTSNDIDTETREKLYLVCEKLKNLTSKRNIDDNDLSTMLLSLKIKDYTKLF